MFIKKFSLLLTGLLLTVSLFAGGKPDGAGSGDSAGGGSRPSGRASLEGEVLSITGMDSRFSEMIVLNPDGEELVLKVPTAALEAQGVKEGDVLELPGNSMGKGDKIRLRTRDQELECEVLQLRTRDRIQEMDQDMEDGMDSDNNPSKSKRDNRGGNS